MFIFTIIYLLGFSIGLAWGLVWVLERGEKTYHLGANYSRPIFLWSSLVFIITYLGNFVILNLARGAFWPLQFCLLCALAVFGWYKEKGYKEQVLQEEQRVLEEINSLEKGLADDPVNTSYHERLSELYERRGEMQKAEEHAEAAARMDPTEKNKWRVKTLKEDREESAESRKS